MDLKKLKGLFIETVNEPVTDSNTASEKKPPTPQLSKNEKPVVNTIKNQSSITEIDETILVALNRAIEKNNLPGEDYLEFMGALKAMANLNLDDKIKFQTVLATLSTKGLTKEKIVDSAMHYLKILDGEKEAFMSTVTNETKSQIESRSGEIKDLEAASLSKAIEIKKLTDEIDKNTKQIEEIKKQIENAKLKIDNAQQKFNRTYDFLKNQIVTNLDKIKEL